MAISHPHFCDTERFYDLVFRFRAKGGSKKHEPYFPKDLIRIEFSLEEQETKKEKWRVFSRVSEFIHCFDKDYKPLGDTKTKTDRINKLMITFPEIMESMNAKKYFLSVLF